MARGEIAVHQIHESYSPRSVVGVSGGNTSSTHLDIYRLVKHGGRLRGGTHTETWERENV